MPDTRPPALPEGYVLVPVDPTPDMIRAGALAILRCYYSGPERGYQPDDDDVRYAEAAFSAMLHTAFCPDCHKPTGGPDGVHTCSPQADASAGRVDADDAAREVIELCRDALAEELGAWDLDPPLHHVLTAHERTDHDHSSRSY